MEDNYEYPTDEQLDKIKNWDCIKGVKPLVDYIESIWWTPSWGFHLKEGRDYFFKNRRVMKLHLDTGGWSGNESIISALEQNFLFWSFCFYKHITGGHYTFSIKKDIYLGKLR